MHAIAIAIGLSLAAVEPAGLSPELEPPQHVMALDEPIDIQREGHACPVFADFDGDGLADLLVGEAFGGRLRIYRNVGTKTEPKFGEYEWFRAGDDVAVVPWARGGYRGFTPQLVDLDGDGKTDVVSGAPLGEIRWVGEIHWFRRIDGTKFAKGERLPDVDGNPLKVQNGAQPACADWDGDGDIDVVAGTLDGNVLLLENRGSATAPKFAPPVPVTAAGQTIKVPSGPVHPCVADWTGDGLPDLLIGALDGNVTLYRNSGTRKAPQLEQGATLIPRSPIKFQDDNVRPRNQSGMKPALCVADFNGDGRTDLILGDGCGRFRGPPRHSPDERLRAEANQSRLDELRKEWANVFQRYRRLTSGTSPKLRGENPTVAAEIKTLRAEIERLDGQISAAQAEVEYDWSRTHQHGFVWVYLRRP